MQKKDLFPALTPKIESEVSEAMSLDGGNRDLCSSFSITIRQDDLRTLRHGKWLNDEIINFYGELCMKRAREIPDAAKIHIFNTFFYDRLSEKGYSAISRWTKRIDIFSQEFIIIPIHLGMHWVCGVINFTLKRFEYYDSLHGSNRQAFRVFFSISL